MGNQGKNKHGEPIFLLQYMNVLYLADICVKFEKNLDSTSFSRELPQIRKYSKNVSDLAR